MCVYSRCSVGYTVMTFMDKEPKGLTIDINLEVSIRIYYSNLVGGFNPSENY